jgi:hypothetical protein
MRNDQKVRGRAAQRGLFLMFAVFALLLSAAGRLSAGDSPRRHRIEPLLAVPKSWPINDTWRSRKVGSSDFYFVENGPYMRVKALGDPKLRRAFEETGLWQRAIPGYLPGRFLSWLDGSGKAGSGERQILREYLEKRWPIWSISYVTARGEPMPSPRALTTAGDLWVGDGSTEYQTYRLEGVLGYLRSGKLGKFSSSADTHDRAWAQYMERKLIPELRRVLPRALNPAGNWTHRDARILSDAFMRTYFERIGRAVAWSVYMSPYLIARSPQNVAVGQRNSNAINVAYTRGIMRSAGGNKFFLHWETAEAAARWMGHSSGMGQITPHGETHGYNLNHIRNLMWRPFLIGAQYSIFHSAPLGLINDVEQDGHHELNVLGETFHDIMDMAEALPDRGTPVASVGLLLDRDRGFAAQADRPITTYLGLRVDFDAADAMISGILHHLFPVHRDSAGIALPNHSARYGEIFDILSPDAANTPVARIFANYKVLFDLGGLQVDAALANALQQYVRDGGVLVMNVADLSPHLPAEFFGVSAGSETRIGRDVVVKADGRRIGEEPFEYQPIQTRGASALYTVDGKPLVTRHAVGRGHAILVGARHMIQQKAVSDRRSPMGRDFRNRPLLKMVPDFLDRLTSGTMPVELRCAPEDREHLTWWVHKKADSWLVFVQNFDPRKRFEYEGGTPHNVLGDYRFRPIEFDLVSSLPIADAVDHYARRSLPLHKRGTETVVTDHARYGDIRIYELSPRPIRLKRNQLVNYALDRPARASHTLARPTHRPKPSDVKTQRFAPRNAVDGIVDNRRYWQSGRGFDPSDYEGWNSLPLPAWLEVDLQQKRRIDHVRLRFHHPPLRETQDLVPWIVRYSVDVSTNGRSWTRVVDETQNVKPVRRAPVLKWFDPVEARFARVNVVSNSARRGAQIVEFGVYGSDREDAVVQRVSPWEPARAFLPNVVQNWPSGRQRFLTDLKPLAVRNRDGRAEQGKQADQAIRTVFRMYRGGHRYAKVLDVPAPHEASWQVPAGAASFAAVAGFQTVFDDRSGVIYRIYVDGKKRFDSGPYYGLDALPIHVDVRGARTLKVSVEDLSDGKQHHAALLAEARFLMERN